MKKNKIIILFVGIGLFCVGFAHALVPSASEKAGVVEHDLTDFEMAPFGDVKVRLETTEEVPGRVTSTLVETKKLEGFLEDDPGASTMQVKGFKFEGNIAVNDGNLQKMVLPFVGRQLSWNQLNSVCTVLTQKYRKLGYFLAEVFLPVQEVKDGVVQINLKEGRLGEVEVEGAKFYTRRFILNHFNPTVNGVLNQKKFLKAVMLLNEYSNLDVQAFIKRGGDANQADVVLRVKDVRPIRLVTDYNNYGSRYISRHRYGTALSHGNVIAQGDNMLVRAVVSDPVGVMSFFSGEYSLPINSYGTKLAFSYEWSDFDVQREFRSLDSAGQSHRSSMKLTQPVIRNRIASLDAFFALDYKENKNYLLGDISSHDKIRVSRLGFSGNHADRFFGRNYYSFDMSVGNNDADVAKASRVGANGTFSKSNFSLARYQKAMGDIYLYAKGNAQVTNEPLPNSEQFAIGGASTVRGYPQSEHLGDSGYLGSVEVRFPPPFISNKKMLGFKRGIVKQYVQLVGFFDYGMTALENAAIGESKSDEIAGTGFGMRLNLPEDISLKMDVGFSIGGSPSSDGSSSVAHLSMTKSFF